MRDWRAYVEERLDLSALEERRQWRIVEELAEQLEDVYRETLAGGVSERDAEATAAALVPDWEALAASLASGARVHRRAAPDRALEVSEGWLRRRGGGWSPLADLARDTRHALRGMRRAPLFWAVTVPVLALGIGATTAIFSVADGVMLKRLPYPAATRLVAMHEPSFPVQELEDWERHATSYESLAGHWALDVDYVAGERPERLRAGLVTPAYFALFGARAEVGRLFVPSDFDGAPSRVVLGHGAWQRLFGGDAGVVGTTMAVQGRSAEIVGVLDASFSSPGGLAGEEDDIWVALDTRWEEVQSPGLFILEVYGRLADGVSVAAAQQEMSQLMQRLAKENPEVHQTRGGEPRPITVIPLQAGLVGATATTLCMLLGAVLLLLLIACANVAHLFLARGTERTHELAVRSALGAGGGRLARQVLTESVAVALAGGVLGVGLAFAGVHVFKVLNPGNIPLVGRIAVDLRVLAFAVGLSVLTGLAFGLLPAWKAARLDSAIALRDEGRSGDARSGSRLRGVLVVSEIALSLVLLTGAALLLHSLVRLRQVNPGFVPEGLAAVTLSVDADRFSADERRVLVDRLLRRVEGLAGVESAAVGLTAPFERFGTRRSGWMSVRFQVDGEDRELPTMVQPVTQRYFEALGAAVRGSTWDADSQDADPVPVVVSRSFADALFPSQEPIGRVFRGLGKGADARNLVVVGVVSGLHHWGLDQGSGAELYVPWERLGSWLPMATLVARTSGDPAWVLPALRRAIWAEDAAMPLPDAFTITGRIDQSLAAPRFFTALLATFAAVAVLLAATGVYGSMLYSVSRRRHELGIRAALGAGHRELLALVLRRSGVLTLAGVAVGTGGALLSTRALERFLFGVAPLDATAFAAAVGIMVLVAMAAAVVPAWRAAGTDPIEVLRAE